MNDRSSKSRSRSGSRVSANRDRIKCFKCREYDHFTKDCINSDIEKESEQIQQISNLDKDRTALKVILADTYDNLIRTNSYGTIDCLNLIKGRIGTTTYLPLNTKIGRLG